ncbi:MAG: YciE/YciF ferroxidase family protein [Bacteroidia bacterium]
MATTTAKNIFKKTSLAPKTQAASSPKNEKDGKEKTLECLFKDGLKEMYSVETQLIEALPKMAQAADSEELQDGFKKHEQETRRHAERLEKIFNRLNIDKSDTEKCTIMADMIADGNKIIDDYEAGPVRDSALIIAAQKVEHFEIAAYGSLCELADVLGYSRIVDILDSTLKEEEDTDDALTCIAQDVNDEAYEMSQREENELEEA